MKSFIKLFSVLTIVAVSTFLILWIFNLIDKTELMEFSWKALLTFLIV